MDNLNEPQNKPAGGAENNPSTPVTEAIKSASSNAVEQFVARNSEKPKRGRPPGVRNYKSTGENSDGNDKGADLGLLGDKAKAKSVDVVVEQVSQQEIDAMVEGVLGTAKEVVGNIIYAFAIHRTGSEEIAKIAKGNCAPEEKNLSLLKTGSTGCVKKYGVRWLQYLPEISLALGALGWIAQIGMTVKAIPAKEKSNEPTKN